MLRLLRIFKTFASIAIILLGLHIPTQGQPVVSNTDHAISVIVQQVDSVLKANQVQGFKLSFSQPTPVRLKLIEALIARGYRVYEMPTEMAEITTLTIDPMLVYRYVGTGKGSGSRSAKGTVGITLTRIDGSVVDTQLSRIDVNDSVMVGSDALDDGLWPMVAFASIEGSGRRSRFKRVLEPAIIVTTVAVTVFLLFNVRSQ